MNHDVKLDNGDSKDSEKKGNFDLVVQVKNFHF